MEAVIEDEQIGLMQIIWLIVAGILIGFEFGWKLGIAIPVLVCVIAVSIESGPGK